MARKIEVDLVANARPFNNTLDAAVGKVTGFKKRLETTGGGSLTKGLAIGAGVASFNLLTSAVESVVSQLDVMHQAFLDDEASQARLQNAVKNTTKNYDEAIKSMEGFAQAQQKMGFEDDKTRDSLFQLVGITHDSKKAIELSGVAMDLARAKNIDLAQATDIVARAYTGVARGLTLVGIDARGAASGTELVKRIMDNTRGAMVAYSNTAQGRVAAANAKLQDTMEKVGGAIDKVSQIAIPVMVAGLGGIVDFLGEAIAAAQTFIGWLNSLVDAILRVAEAATHLTGPLGALLNIGRTILGGIVPGQFQGGGGGGSTPGHIVIPPTGTGPHVTPIGRFHSGGVVAGPAGSDQVIIAQAGERVVARGEGAGQVININIASFIGSDHDIDRFADKLAFRLRSTSLS